MANCCIIGLGYIGLPSAICIANAGHKVLGIDTDLEKINKINSCEVPINEPNLKEELSKVIKNGSLKADSRPSQNDIFLIAVPTPIINHKNKIPEPNLDYIFSAIDSIIPYLQKGNLIILESTSPVGISDLIIEFIQDKIKFNVSNLHICYCPERVIPGNILFELKFNDRIVGSNNKESAILAKEFYESFCEGNIRITESKVAEISKLVENSYRDVNIAFANEISMICNELEIDPWEVISLSNNHPRVNILDPGCGVGGHCIAVDPWFIASSDPINSGLIQKARITNDNKAKWVVDKIIKESIKLKKRFNKNIVIGIFGLSYKANVEDVRESPAIYISRELIKNDEKLIICEPNLDKFEEFDLYHKDYLIKNSDLLVFLVGHKDFINIDLKGKPFLDFCGLRNQE